MSEISVQIPQEMLKEEQNVEIDLRISCKCDPKRGLVCRLTQIKPVVLAEDPKENFETATEVK